MSTTSTEIIDFVVNDAVSYISSLIQGKLFSDALEKMADFFETQAELKASIPSVLTEERVAKGVDPLVFYLEQFESHLKSAARGYPSNLDKFLHDAGDTNNGAHERLNKFYNSVTGQPGTKIGGSTLDVWHADAFQKLSDAALVNYHIVNYVDEIDEKLSHVCSLLRNGIIILTLTTSGTSPPIPVFRPADALIVSDPEQAQEWADKWAKKMTELQDVAYKNYPSVLKLLIPGSYDADWLPAETEWRFEYVNDPSTLLTLWLPNVPFVFPSKEYPKGAKYTRWKFDPSLEEGAVGLNCKSRRAALLELRPDFEPGKTVERSFSMEEAAQMVTNGKKTLFKIVPFVDSGRPDAALVSIREVASGRDVWGIWILSVQEDNDY
ncbi:hypothetical protein FRC10_007855 [Ceratobasidium sp. 414]|nr:hypothetical protein FRC10_007855 [Ceratobasidium sp. 414]